MIDRVNQNYSQDYLQQMHQYRHRYKKGLGQVMQQLTPDQRQQISSALQNLPQDLRAEAKNQILQLDLSSISPDQLFTSVMDIISSVASSQTSESSVSVYA
ncbi:hypothetical protein SAMN06265339_0194 [Desulfurobacterium pacificum]|uniref:Uncharacterized protein n=1 Tax=Desulfurobacterium pacificum TaxID=240166 RepID=A0ABY1N9U1_9BACT|nr:hypothetical protein [Desulfurobacterium pacificum]SMP04283.1 hypothetical protein SAMN06265339_0194 [Desulfurobacterium pacificum]